MRQLKTVPVVLRSDEGVSDKRQKKRFSFRCVKQKRPKNSKLFNLAVAIRDVGLFSLGSLY